MTIHRPDFKCQECEKPYAPFNYENSACPSCGHSDGTAKEGFTVVPDLVEDAKYNTKCGGMAIMTMADLYILHAARIMTLFKKEGEVLPEGEELDTLCEKLIQESKPKFPTEGTWKEHIHNFTKEVLKYYDKNREDPALTTDDLFMG